VAGARTVRVVGDVVLRPAGPWTATVHHLLRHLHARGLPTPEPLGVVDGVERVSLVRGDAGQDAWRHQVHVDGVRSAGVLLRRVHDATRSFEPPVGAVWSVPPEGGPVICHGDVQPANTAWRDGVAVGLFDWDAARPAEPLSDVAYALEWLTPFVVDRAELARRGLPEAPARRERIDAFLDGYGWDGEIDVVDAVLERQQRAVDEVVHLGAAGHEPHATWVRQGWPARWASKLDVTRSLAEEVS
jgi:hypothetical protein